MSNSQKISQFTGATTVNDSDLVTIVSNGQNFKLSYADLKNSLGVTGSLSGLGAPLATPILNDAGNNNYQVRAIQDGPGVISSITAEGGINLRWNVAQDATGIALVDDVNADKPEFKSLVNGTGIVLTETDGAITVTATGEANPNNTVIINQESDFPVQDATTITLEAGRIHVIADNITTSKYFIVEDGSRLTANNFFSPILAYTGTGSMFVGVDASFAFDNIRYDHPNAQGFDFTDTVGNQKLVLIDTARCISGTKFGTFNNMQTVSIAFSSTLDMDDGVTITGQDMSVLTIDKFFQASTNASFVGLDLTDSISLTTEIDDMIAVGPAGSIGLKTAANSENVPTGAIATVSGCNFAGVDTALSGGSPDDIRWQYIQNSGIPDSMTDGLISIEANTTETTISVVDTPVKIAGTFTTEDVSRFTHDGTGRLTYIAETTERLPIDFTSTILMASGGDAQITVYVAINGSIISQTGKQGTSNSSKAASITAIWQHDFQTNDYVEFWVENNSNTTNIVCQQAVERIN